MSNGNTLRAASNAIFGRTSRHLATSVDQLTASVIVELTNAEIAQVAGGLEQNNASFN